jgi:hypothetical protein
MLTQVFMITHHKLSTYYIQSNGQAKSTNKTLGKILVKIINANRTYWDVMLIMLWAY